MADPVLSVNGKRPFILASEFLRTYKKDIEWVVEPFLVPGSAMMIYGRQGAGKSRLAWQLAYALSTGTPWIGFPVARPHRVMYLNSDMPYVEFLALAERAQRDGMTSLENIVVPNPSDFESIDVLNTKHYKMLKDFIGDEHIEGVIVDVIAEIFTPRGSDVNATARQVVNHMRRLTAKGLLVYLNHERKKVDRFFAKKDESDEDDDLFLGAGEWERAATSSLRIKKEPDASRKLFPKKTRILPPGFRELPLMVSKNGFFTAVHGYAEVLRTWPRYVPYQERFAPESQADVFKDVARRCEVSLDAVKKNFQRGRDSGVFYEWADYLTGDRDKGHVFSGDVPDASQVVANKGDTLGTRNGDIPQKGGIPVPDLSADATTT